jgi:hypothetical protein
MAIDQSIARRYLADFLGKSAKMYENGSDGVFSSGADDA